MSPWQWVAAVGPAVAWLLGYALVAAFPRNTDRPARAARSPLRCRWGLHRWRRRPVLTTPDLTLQWRMLCDRCRADRDRFQGVAP